jgi:hypothetical protein
MVASWADEVVGRHLGRPTSPAYRGAIYAWTFSGGRLKATFDHPNAYPGRTTAQSAPTKLCTETTVFNVLLLKASTARTDFWGTPGAAGREGRRLALVVTVALIATGVLLASNLPMA